MPFTVARSFDDQVLHAISLVREERFVSAAVVLAQLPDVDRTHRAAVLTELERRHAHNAIAALELIQDLYRPAPRPRLLLLAGERCDGKSLT